jgi:hypothetical protein
MPDGFRWRLKRKKINLKPNGELIMILNMKALIAALILIPSLAFAQSGPKLYAPDGTYLGRVNNNQFDSESISNPYGKYGSRFSNTSINNPFSRYGSQFSTQSPNYGAAGALPPIGVTNPFAIQPIGGGF